MFLPPEAFGAGNESFSDSPDLPDVIPSNAWDVAIRYHEFKSRAVFRGREAELRRISAQAILDRARVILGSVVRPHEECTSPWESVPPEAEQPEIDLEETLENAPLALWPGADPAAVDFRRDLWMSYQLPRRQSVVLSVDTSLSMTGEKLALTAVALAVVLLQFPDDPIGIVAFENAASVLKRPEERISLQQLIERFLDVPAQGYTHLEEGMRVSLELTRSATMRGRGRPPSTVLLTDGKYTAGRDPAYLAPRFPHLVVLKMGRERASLELCRELARKGRGTLREVGELEGLPGSMYGIVKDLLRGRSL